MHSEMFLLINIAIGPAQCFVTASEGKVIKQSTICQAQQILPAIFIQWWKDQVSRLPIDFALTTV